jgi:putative oxidoreductase
MKKFFENNKDIGVLVLRLIIGFTFAFIYGLMKIEGGPELWAMIGGTMNNVGIASGHTFWGFMASLSEFGGGILLMLGLFVRPVVLFMAFTMIMATTTHLAMKDQWYNVFQPVEMFGVFVALLFLGAGKYSLDYIFFKKNKNSLN